MKLLNIFKRKRINYAAENMRTIRSRIADRENDVYKAVALINRPCTAREIAKFLNLDSASVTPRLPRLVRKDRIQIFDRKRGIDGIYRNRYVTKHF